MKISRTDKDTGWGPNEKLYRKLVPDDPDVPVKKSYDAKMREYIFEQLLKAERNARGNIPDADMSLTADGELAQPPSTILWMVIFLVSVSCLIFSFFI